MEESISPGAAQSGVLVSWGIANGVESSAVWRLNRFGPCSVRLSTVALHRQKAQLQKQDHAALLLFFPVLKCSPGDPLCGLNVCFP